MARILTFPECVSPHNIEKLRQCVRNGPDKYPGARMLRHAGGLTRFIIGILFHTHDTFATELFPVVHACE